ncbi:protein kinase family protein [Frigoriglobus tundricola]|uniref:Protein kinase domain-containing protein n=1 Tax=Frigoriglobus tundricola TaxID=2774151 RepID=A0A6M5YMN4_9BACT|nr:hypothetical protein [Frigoriglobus tundricola]QJW94501.1 hypothetical protein FTUN_2022 [Frigoriglobus tundricola]
MSWPLAHEFNEAVQNPRTAFADPDLRAAEAVVGATGLPLPRSGNFADVYQVRGADGRDWAVKCFTRPVVGLADRYARVSEALAAANLPFTVGFTYLTEGIWVGGAWRPAVKMEWVEGFQLNQVVRDNAAKPAVLSALGQMWGRLCKRLREAGIAHADVQHGNVLLVPGSRPGAFGLKLIDYDGMWLPALANTPSGESGHPAFQHPARAATRAYSADVDRFPHLVVATALKGLSVVGPALWAKCDTGDNLLFTEDDYKKPAESKLMKELWHAGDPGLQSLVGRLAIACGKPLPQTPWLDQLAPEGDVTPLDDATRREAAAALGVPLPVPVPLPPEPSYPSRPPEPVRVPAPVADLVPTPVTAAAVRPRAETAAGDEIDVELVAPKRPRGKKKKANRDEKTPAGGMPAWVLITGGALVMAAVAVAAVLFSGGKKPQETVQGSPAPPAVPVEPGAAPKAPAEDPKPKEKADPLVKDEAPDTVVPPAKVVAESVPYEPPSGEPPALKPRWTADVPHFCDHISFALTGRTLLAGSSRRGGGAALDVATGGRRDQFADLLKGPSATFFPLTGGRVGTWAPGAFTIDLWNDQTGERRQKLDLPAVPQDDTGCSPQVSLSRNARYAAVGWVRTQYASRPVSDLALRVFDLTTRNTVVSLDWTGGHVHFTADASRVLVAEFYGRCRWFKLPSGEPDGEWSLDAAAGPGHSITGTSANGSVLAHVGSLKRNGGLGTATVDGKTGAVLRLLTPTSGLDSSYRAGISADARRIAVPWADTQGNLVYDVSDLRTGAIIGRIASGAPLCSATFSPDGTALALTVGGAKPSVQLFDIPAGAAAPAPPAPGGPPDAATPPAPGPVAQLRVRWSAGTKTKMNGKVYIDRDGQAVAIVNSGVPWNIAAFDARTGASVRDLPDLTSNFFRMFRLEKGKFGYQDTAEKRVVVWDPAAGKATPVPFPTPAGLGGHTPYVNVSPDGRYIAAGHFVSGGGKEPTPTELRVIDTTTDQSVVMLDWLGGTTAFTADSSRVLVLDDTGRFRWFKLPAGQPDGEWAFGLKPNGFNARDLFISADGGVILYHGRPPQKEEAHHLLDGKTGAVLHSFPANRYLSYAGSVSDDGRHVMLLRTDGFGTGHTVEVRDVRGRLVASAKMSQAGDGARTTADISWKGRAVAMHDPGNKKVAVYDLPDLTGTAAAVPDPDVPPLKANRSIECQTKLTDAAPYFADDGQTLVLVATTGPVAAAAFNVRTGAAGKELTAPLKKGQFHHLFALEKAKVAIQSDTDKELLVWEPGTGKTSVRSFPAPAVPGGVPSVNVSPDGRYLAVGSARPAPGLKGAEAPLQVIDTVSRKPVVSLNWHAGATAFTADSTRVLVVDDTDRFRWFKLPAGRPDGEWAFDREPDGNNARLMGTSARGEAVLYHGRPPGKDEAAHLLDGKNGTVLHSFAAQRHLDTGGSVSDDGKSVMLITRATADGTHWAEVFDARGALCAAVKLPPGDRTVAVSWKTRVAAIYDRAAQRVTTYDLPAPAGP